MSCLLQDAKNGRIVSSRWRGVALLGWFLAIALGMSQVAQVIISPTCTPAEVRHG